MTLVLDSASAGWRPDEGRLAWADAARGLSILLVVHFHAFLLAKSAGLISGDVLFVTSEPFRLLRMPLLFFVSGIFAARVLRRPWPDLVDRRLSTLLWVLLVWGLVNLAAALVRAAYHGRPTSTSQLFLGLVVPDNYLWFLWALALYLLAARLLRPVPVAITLALATALSLGTDWRGLPGSPWEAAARFFAFFALGAAAADMLPRLVGRIPAAVVVPAFAAAVAAHMLAPGLRGGPEGVALALLGITATLGLLHRVERRAVGRALAWVGGRSLPIYAMHWPVASAACRILVEVGVTAPALGVAVLAAAGLTVPLAAHALAPRFGLGWLFRRPAWFAPAALLRPATPGDEARRSGAR